MTTSEDPALAELKKQTRIMQRKESAQSMIGGFFLGILLSFAVVFFTPLSDPPKILAMFIGLPIIMAIIGAKNWD